MVSKELVLTNAQGFHMRPASVFATAMGKYSCDVTIKFNGNQYNAKSLLNIIAACIKCGSEIEVVCDGADENEALAEAVQLIESGWRIMAPTDQLQEVKIMLHGTAASEGIGIGKVMLIEEHSLEYTPRTVTDTEAESQRFKAAVDAFCYNTEKQAENLRSSAGEKEAEILAGHIQIIKDPYLSGEIEKLIADGQCAESALEHMCDMFIAMFSAADDELTKQRAADVRDIKSGVLGILLGVNEIKVSDAPKGTVLVARELTPSVTAGIVKENIAGIITETSEQLPTLQF